MNKFEKLMMIAARPALWRPFLRGAVASMEHHAALHRLDLRTCIDIGANKGQFSVLCQYLFPGIRIFAFEPLPDVAKRCEAAIGNANSQVHVHALGAIDNRSQFYVTERSDSSSLLLPGIAQERAYGSRVAGAVDVDVHRLDGVMTAAQIARPALMKLDVQGAELDVLAGCGSLLRDVDYIYLEGSFVELYEGQALITDIVTFLDREGFAFRGVYNTSYTRDYGTTQADFLFERVPRPDDVKDTRATIAQPVDRGLIPA
ncbi:MAG: FkbM family methyltransferase [Pseudorhodoplanes sp.]|uniref:FkbM family methyltransferase n=1 Tax=Pseudorhodoplanes sp. TaxID=1934341 RepID=UPI003D0BE930